MSKRRLTRRQAWRIKKIQQERAERVSRREEIVETLENATLGPEQLGLVTAHFGTQVEIEPLDDSDDRPAPRRCHLRANLGSLVTGDKVVFCDGDPYGVVVSVEPRTSSLSRPDSHGKMKTIAANIDRIIVVIAPVPEPFALQIDRYTIASEASGITPIILLNKVDRLDDNNREALLKLLTIYSRLGYEVLQCSSQTGEGLDQLRSLLGSFTSVFVGQSGVGKSSLVNALLPDAGLKVGALSDKTELGKHTTTTAQLFHFSGGGHLIDSPGIREFGLWHMQPDELAQSFCEFRELLGQCKFRDCTHLREPGCAVLAARKRGDLFDSRVESYRLLRAACEENTDR